MVGIFGKRGDLVLLVTAKILILLASINSLAVICAIKAKSTSPAATAVAAGEAPRYGACTTSNPA